MTTIYLIRHCEAQGNLHRRVHGIFDSDVTPKGRRQLACLQKRFEPVALDAVYSSNLTRAQKTAASIADPKGLAVIVEPQLHERSMGAWEDYSWHEVERRCPEAFAAWRTDPYYYQIPGGESEEQGGLRLHAALSELARQNSGKTIAVVAHSMVIKIFQQLVTGCGYEETGWGENTSVSLLHVGDDGAMSFDYRNDASHLPEDLTALAKQSWSKGSSSLASYSLEYREADSALYAQVLSDAAAQAQCVGVCVAGIEEGDPVGLAQAVQTGDRAELTLLFVRADRRRLGYGSQLVGELEYRLKGSGALTLTARVAGEEDEQAAQARFLEANSFIAQAADGGGTVYVRTFRHGMASK